MSQAAHLQTAPAATEVGMVVRGAGTFATTIGPGAAATSTVTRVAANAANVTLLASNANRRGACIINSSPGGANLFVKFGVTANIGAGTESFTVRITPFSYYEVPFGYTGQIDGIWDAADANGEALMTELT